MFNITCNICNKPMSSNDFEKAEDSKPLYLVDPRFHSEIKEKIFFCGAAHATEWTENQRKLKK